MIKITFALAPLFGCPQMCSCLGHIDTNGNSTVFKSVDCGGRNLNERTLAQELDLLLSNDNLRETLLGLNITNTPLTRVPMSVCQLSNLQLLGLDNNRLVRLPDNCFTNMTGLIKLSAQNNSITELQDGLFDGLNSLRNLDFGYNTIASIGIRVFSDPNDLVNLKMISLAYNRLSSLEPWPHIRGLHGSSDSKVYIWLQFNRIWEFTNNIKWQINCSRRSHAYLSIDYNYVRHVSDIERGWNFAVQTGCLASYTSMYTWPYTLDQLYISKPAHKYLALFIDISYSFDYYCDCRDMLYLILSKIIPIFFTYTQALTCSQPQSFANWLVAAVPLKEFVCVLPDRCPPSCRCVNHPANGTFHVDCSAVNLTSLPLDLPPLPGHRFVYKLDFSNNKLLRRLEHRSYFVNSSVLDFSNCAIDFVDENAWRTFPMMRSELVDGERSFTIYNNYSVGFHRVVIVPAVFLHGNKIESLSVGITEINLTSVHLTLYDNPWKCSCDNRWMITWFKSLSSGASSNIGENMCDSPSRLKGRSISQSDEDDFCVDPLTRMLKIVLSSTLLVVAGLLMLGVAVYHLRVRLYKRWKFHPFDRDECDGEGMDYDVFLCCSSEDNTPHGLRILQLIESKGYRVCYHLRDFVAGEPVTDNMMQSIVRSKRTVCFVSSNFLQR